MLKIFHEGNHRHGLFVSMTSVRERVETGALTVKQRRYVARSSRTRRGVRLQCKTTKHRLPAEI